MHRPRILMRTVAGHRVGYGHLTRCLSLAQALAHQGARPVFAMCRPEPGVRAMIGRAGLELAELAGGEDEASSLADLMRGIRSEAAVLDGYIFGQAYLDALAGMAPTLWLDDLRQLRATSLLVLNQNPAARPEDYPGSGSERLLLGLGYALLRPSFLAARLAHPRTTPERARRLLITFGGSDPNHLCGRALAGLGGSQGRYLIRVVAGAADGAAQAARAEAAASPHQVEVLERVEDMPALMAWADLALCGSGVTGYEMCCLGLPMLVVTPVDNQRPVSRGLEEADLIRHLGWWEKVSGADMARAVDVMAADVALRRRLSRAGQAAVDGRGADRVARALLEASA